VLNNMNIIFTFIVFHFSSDFQFKSKLSEEIQLKELNLIIIANILIIVPKLDI
jgi:restriction endonuclease S subunit